jgi:hypothetical protein
LWHISFQATGREILFSWEDSMNRKNLLSIFSQLKFKRIVELNPWRAFLMVCLASFGSWYLAIFLISYFNVVFIILCGAWIPYSVWVSLCKYFRYKDVKKEGVDRDE